MMSYNNRHLDDALTFSLLEHGREFELGRFFELWELRCNDGTDLVKVHPLLLVLLNDIRANFSARVSINSGYRTPTYNERIGGATASRHLLGMAADIVVFNVSPEDVAFLAEEWGVGGVGRYNSFTHVDVAGEDRRWDNR